MRPWRGKVESQHREQRPAYDPNCYLCPGNSRAGGIANPKYEKTFVFTNDFSALLPDIPETAPPGEPLLQSEAARGNSIAQDGLGYVYQYGMGLPQDRSQAVHWYQKAAAQGNSDGAGYAFMNQSARL